MITSPHKVISNDELLMILESLKWRSCKRIGISLYDNQVVSVIYKRNSLSFSADAVLVPQASNTSPLMYVDVYTPNVRENEIRHAIRRIAGCLTTYWT